MIKKQTFEIMALIKQYFEHFEITQNKVDSWHELLQDADYEQVRNTLINFCKRSKFPPKVADLLNAKPATVDRMNAIPSVEETKEYLAKMAAPNELTDQERASIEKSKAEIRRMLGIGD
ncbi:replicative helicase loader/inhibitor [Bacillus atrophaeus]|uniref:replicative helicase loader/inhibitor n=1 Tax=Bacillus atrophaeus TaxID=1452 RepID=UPI002282077F|nr:replicative helicase loader/inhibitor [Bacillus atrophaeus]MCY7947336.1 replicative helicase loader/inhibitor [Bacillus atrophaeus]MCY8098356.1 replicative helicase loader/inhibitor [Bacillus atrophaeus]MCY9168100.1 replicative helicase loader/inhibitor [Bacillus atrophaeus]MEC0742040.1 replicative helicase loader/inhibitor [Bacillus atrophaeus]MEC0744646.1 replicative helicase loader/inhibitor [Bacillus atrophaeus]